MVRMPEAADLSRLRREYTDRESRLAGSDIYSPFNIANLFTLHQRQRETLAELRELDSTCLTEKQILEIGCGRGRVLLEYLGYGTTPQRLYGCDLLFERIQDAHHTLPHLPLTCADGQNLPFLAHSFDIELQYTTFSSILDAQVKANLAREMLRTLRPGGIILWYDFWLNPTNQQTRGILPAEIRQLFPGCQYIFRKITLAPPIARRIVPFSWPLAFFLERLQIFNSHYLAVIRTLYTNDPASNT